MKLFVEQLPLSNDTSFVARTHRTPHFEVPWHQHAEYELILFKEGTGFSFVGNYVGEFEPGDVFFLGANLPHTFKKGGEFVTSAVVVHFAENFWGNEFLMLPESRKVASLLRIAGQGMKISGESKSILQQLLATLENETGFKRIITLCNCLNELAEHENYLLLSTQEVKPINQKNRERIDRIFKYTMENFQEQIPLADIAAVADLSIPAFCNYFKKSTRKRYVDFLNEIRIGFACNLIVNSNMTIENACYECGFNTLANFNKQFIKVKKMTPSKYRAMFKYRESALPTA